MKYKHVTARILGLGLCVSLLSTVTLAASGIPYTGRCGGHCRLCGPGLPSFWWTARLPGLTTATPLTQKATMPPWSTQTGWTMPQVGFRLYRRRCGRKR